MTAALSRSWAFLNSLLFSFMSPPTRASMVKLWRDLLTFEMSVATRSICCSSKILSLLFISANLSSTLSTAKESQYKKIIQLWIKYHRYELTQSSRFSFHRPRLGAIVSKYERRLSSFLSLQKKQGLVQLQFHIYTLTWRSPHEAQWVVSRLDSGDLTLVQFSISLRRQICRLWGCKGGRGLWRRACNNAVIMTRGFAMDQESDQGLHHRLGCG